MGETITLTAEDGHTFSAYRAMPAGTPRGGLVVLQEIFGVNDHIRKVCEGFAADGYLALAPALFDRVEEGFETGYLPADIDRGRAVRGKLSTDDALTDIRAAVGEVADAGLPVGVVGYCFGGTMAWLAATRLDRVAAAVGYYGGGIADAAHEQPRCPVLLHFGETDASIPREHFAKVMALHPEVPVHIYPAGHGFNCEARASYSEPSAALARGRTLEFFRRHLDAAGKRRGNHRDRGPVVDVEGEPRAGVPRRDGGAAAPGGPADVAADEVTMRQSGARTVEAGEVTIRQGGALRVEAEEVKVTQGGIVLARADKIAATASMVGAAIAREVDMEAGAAHLVLAGEEAELEQAAAGVVVSRKAEVQDSVIGLLVAGRVEGQNVRVLMGTAAAFAFGAGVGLVWWLLGRWRRG